MKRALGQDVLNHPLGQRAVALILFKHNHHRHPRRDLCAVLTIHRLFLLLVLAGLKEPEQRQPAPFTMLAIKKGPIDPRGFKVITQNNYFFAAFFACFSAFFSFGVLAEAFLSAF